jgi:hypothetical protein
MALHRIGSRAGSLVMAIYPIGSLRGAKGALAAIMLHRRAQVAYVTLGTIIADAPLHRTVRALLRIRLPPWLQATFRVVTCKAEVNLVTSAYRNFCQDAKLVVNSLQNDRPPLPRAAKVCSPCGPKPQGDRYSSGSPCGRHSPNLTVSDIVVALFGPSQPQFSGRVSALHAFCR